MSYTSDEFYVDTNKYQPIVNELIHEFAQHNIAYQRLETLCIKYGHRLTGSTTLDNAIDWIYNTMISDGLDNVMKMPVQCPNWKRNAAHACIIRSNTQHNSNIQHNIDNGICDINVSDGDLYRKLNVLALGSCISGSVTGEIVLCESYEQLDELGKQHKLKGKIVLWNKAWCNNYGSCAKFRWDGAKRAESYGATASLIRSVASESLATPHTGTQDASNIPGVAITIEDAELITRLINSGESVTVHLCTSNTTGEDVTHHNVIGEIVGSEKPDEIVIVSGHVDSWDVGQGAMDDGSGLISAWEVVRLLKKLGYKPRRTIRAVIWVDEEQRTSGSEEYIKQYKSQLSNHVAAFESDMGVWNSIGFGYAGTVQSEPVVQQLLDLLKPLNATKLDSDGLGML